MRQSEIRFLQWGQVDMELGQIHLETTKSGHYRIVPLVGQALELLWARPHVSPYVFSSRRRKNIPWSFRKPFEQAVKRAEIPDFTFHGLRHSCGSYLAMNGATPIEIAAVLGHRTLAMVRRYAHVADEHSREVLRDLDRKLFK